MAATAIERIVVQTTSSDKQTIVAKAKKFDMPISELMRRAVFAYDCSVDDAELGALADAAQGAAERSGTAIDNAMDFIAASNGRIALMETAAVQQRKAG